MPNGYEIYAAAESNYEKTVEYLTKAAGLGDAQAHYALSNLYHFGHGVERDREKETRHLEEAWYGSS